jgi:hypothetical protein
MHQHEMQQIFILVYKVIEFYSFQKIRSYNRGHLFLFGQSFMDRHDAQKRLSPYAVLGITL